MKVLEVGTFNHNNRLFVCLKHFVLKARGA